MTRALIKANWECPIPSRFLPVWDIYTPASKNRTWFQIWVLRYTVWGRELAHEICRVEGWEIWRVVE